MKNKTAARISSIQSIYQYVICDNNIPIEDIINNVIKHNEQETQKLDKYFHMNIEFFSEIVKLTISDLEKLDGIIILNLGANWSMSSIHVTLLSLIRCGVAELIFFPETPTKVIISEYTNIASTMLSDGEEDFVNGILENIAKKIREK